MAYMLSQVLEGTAMTMIMNTEDGNGFEMWRLLCKHYEPDSGHTTTRVFVRLLASNWQLRLAALHRGLRDLHG